MLPAPFSSSWAMSSAGEGKSAAVIVISSASVTSPLDVGRICVDHGGEAARVVRAAAQPAGRVGRRGLLARARARRVASTPARWRCGAHLLVEQVATQSIKDAIKDAINQGRNQRRNQSMTQSRSQSIKDAIKDAINQGRTFSLNRRIDWRMRARSRQLRTVRAFAKKGIAMRVAM
eukprot:4826648-Prymnesium_polylepis.1